MTDAVQMTVLSSKTHVLVMNQPQMVYVLLELKPANDKMNVRLPLNFILVLDVSASMRGEKLHMVKEAVKNIIDQLQPSDMLTVVTFETNKVVLIPIQYATDTAAMKARVEDIQAGGGTQIAPALRDALEQVRPYHTAERISRVVLLTDGSTSNPKSALAAADQAAQMGVPLIGLGIGPDWKEDFLQEMTDRSLGLSAGSESGYTDYIQDPGQTRRIFQNVLQSMQVYASQVALTMRMILGAEARRVWQVTPLIKDLGVGVIQGRAAVVPVGDLESSGCSYLVEMMVPTRPEGLVRAGQVDTSFNLQTGGLQRVNADLILTYTKDVNLANQVNPKVMNVLERLRAFNLQTRALNAAQSGNVAGATQQLRQAVTILINQGETELAQKMELEAQNLEQGQGISSDGAKTIKISSRVTRKLEP